MIEHTTETDSWQNYLVRYNMITYGGGQRINVPGVCTVWARNLPQAWDLAHEIEQCWGEVEVHAVAPIGEPQE